MSNKVILINSLCAGGAERVVSQLCVEESDVIIQIWNDKFYNINNAKVVSLINKKGFILFDLFVSIFKLFFYIKSNNIKLINSHLFWSNYLNVIVSFFSGHYTVCTHCVSFESKFSKLNLSFIFHSLLMRFVVSKSDLHTYKSLDMKKEYEDRFNFSMGKVIYNPYDFNYSLELSLKDNDTYSFEENITYLLCVGRFHKTKNQEACLEVLLRLPENYKIIFLGDGDRKDFIIDLARSLGLEERCIFAGNVKNPFFFYKKCEFYISMSTSEGFPNSLIESISFGCYPFVYDCSTGPREILTSLYKKQAIKVGECIERYELGTLITEFNYNLIAKDIINSSLDKISVNNDSCFQLVSLLEPTTIRSSYDFNSF